MVVLEADIYLIECYYQIGRFYLDFFKNNRKEKKNQYYIYIEGRK